MSSFAPVRVDPKYLTDGPASEMAMPGMHGLVMPALLRAAPPSAGARVLDVGAGQGALALRLRDVGYQVSACDMYPEMFKAPGIVCLKVDAHGRLPYDDAAFDLVTAFEVTEHLESHASFFTEVARVLKPGGRFVFTTPNIMSLKSRMMFLLTGYMNLHGPLDPAEQDPVDQHISAFSPDRYRFILAQCGFTLDAIDCDKKQRTSLMLGFLAPFIRWRARARYGRTPGVEFNNCPAALYGRILVGIATRV